MTSTQLVSALVSSGAGILTVGGAAFVVAFIVQMTKGFILSGLSIKDQTDAQVRVTQLYVFLVSLLVVLGDAWLNYLLRNRIDISNDIASSITVTIVAIGFYHLLTSNALPAQPAISAAAPAIPASPQLVEIPTANPSAIDAPAFPPGQTPSGISPSA